MTYPISLIYPLQLADGTLIQLRPIHPVDGKIASCFRSQLSDKSIRDRFLGYIPKMSKKLVDRLTKIDYDQEMAIVAEVIDHKKKIPVAVSRIVGESKNRDNAEFAMIIADEWQGRGLGSKLMDYMIDIAKDMKFKTIYALYYAHNLPMKSILIKKGFDLEQETQGIELGTMKLESED